MKIFKFDQFGQNMRGSRQLARMQVLYLTWKSNCKIFLFFPLHAIQDLFTLQLIFSF